MNIVKLSEADLSSAKLFRAEPTIRFNMDGRIFINRSAVHYLNLYNEALKVFTRVSVCHDDDCPHEFFLMKDPTGKVLKFGAHGEARFYDALLARHVVQKTFEHCAHAAGTPMPDKYSFRIARFPVDDDKNKDVYALLRKNG